MLTTFDNMFTNQTKDATNLPDDVAEGLLSNFSATMPSHLNIVS